MLNEQQVNTKIQQHLNNFAQEALIVGLCLISVVVGYLLGGINAG